MTDAHEAIRQDVQQEAADKLLGIESEGLFSISIFSVAIAQSDLTVLDFNDAVIGQRDAVGVAAEVIKHGLWGAKRLLRIDYPVLFT